MRHRSDPSYKYNGVCLYHGCWYLQIYWPIEWEGKTRTVSRRGDPRVCIMYEIWVEYNLLESLLLCLRGWPIQPLVTSTLKNPLWRAQVASLSRGTWGPWCNPWRLWEVVWTIPLEWGLCSLGVWLWCTPGPRSRIGPVPLLLISYSIAFYTTMTFYPNTGYPLELLKINRVILTQIVTSKRIYKTII